MGRTLEREGADGVLQSGWEATQRRAGKGAVGRVPARSPLTRQPGVWAQIMLPSARRVRDGALVPRMVRRTPGTCRVW